MKGAPKRDKVSVVFGRFPFDQKFRNEIANGPVFSGWLDQAVPGDHVVIRIVYLNQTTIAFFRFLGMQGFYVLVGTFWSAVLFLIG